MLDPWRWREEESLLFLQTTLEWEPEHYPIFLTSLHSGMRSGEVIGLQWQDIDWHGRFISLRRQVVHGKVTTLKTKSSRRKVDCSDALLSTLATLKKKAPGGSAKKRFQWDPWVGMGQWERAESWYWEHQGQELQAGMEQAGEMAAENAVRWKHGIS